MLRLLLDADCDPDIAIATRKLVPDCEFLEVRSWQGGKYRTAADALIIETAHEHTLTLVSRDVSTIPPLTDAQYASGKEHSGVILIDERAYPRAAIGMTARALAAFWRKRAYEDWRNRVMFL